MWGSLDYVVYQITNLLCEDHCSDGDLIQSQEAGMAYCGNSEYEREIDT